MDVNGAGDTTNDCDEDTSSAGDSSGAFGDHRYFYHQDRNWNVVALSDYGSGVHGEVVERSAYAPYGESVVLAGNTRGTVAVVSEVGNTLGHQGLVIDRETTDYYNRHRSFSARLGRFTTRDPLQYAASYNSYEYAAGAPSATVDPSGLIPRYERCEPECPGTICSSQCNLQPQGTLGFTGCFQGFPCCCVCDRNISRSVGWWNRRAAQIVTRCTHAHEQVHIDRMNAQGPSACPPPTPPPPTWPFPPLEEPSPPPPNNDHECAGQAVGLACIADGAPECTGIGCRRALCDIIADHNCGSGSGTPCPPQEVQQCIEEQRRALLAYGCL